jgi:hypothetical protein
MDELELAWESAPIEDEDEWESAIIEEEPTAPLRQEPVMPSTPIGEFRSPGFFETLGERAKGAITAPYEAAKTGILGLEVLTGQGEEGDKEELYSRTIEPFTQKETLIPLTGAAIGGGLGLVTTGGLGTGVGAGLGAAGAKQVAEWFGVLPETTFGSKAADVLADITGAKFGQVVGRKLKGTTEERAPTRAFSEQMQVEVQNPNAPSQLLGFAPKNLQEQRASKDLNRILNDPTSEVNQKFFTESAVSKDGIETSVSPSTIGEAKNKATVIKETALQNRLDFFQKFKEKYGDIELKKDDRFKTAIENTDPWKRLEAEVNTGLKSGNKEIVNEALNKKQYLDNLILSYKTGVPINFENIQFEIDKVNDELKELQAYNSTTLGRPELEPSQKLKFETAELRQAALMQVREQILKKADPEFAVKFDLINKEYQDAKDLERSFSTIEDLQSKQRTREGAADQESAEVSTLGYATGAATTGNVIGAAFGGAINQIRQTIGGATDYITGKDPRLKRMQAFDKKTQESLQLLKNRQALMQGGQLPNRRPIVNPDGTIGKITTGIGSLAELLGIAQAVVPTKLNTQLVSEDVFNWGDYIYKQAATPLPNEDIATADMRATAMAQKFIETMQGTSEKDKRKMLAELQSLRIIPHNPYNEIDGKIELPQDRQLFINDKKTELNNTGDVISFAKQLNAMSNPYDGAIITDKAKSKDAQRITDLANQYR